jgi:Polyketide cyclase / dehydrase and lipid transport
MPSDLQPVGLEFFETAPFRHVSTEVVHRPADAIFAAISEDPAGWGSWFPGFSHQGRFLTPPPHGVGAVREVVMLGTRFREEVLAWEAPHRWAFRVDQSSLPFANALAEDYRVVPDRDYSVVQWTLALDPGPALRLATPLTSLLLPSLFRRAMRNLSRRLG